MFKKSIAIFIIILLLGILIRFFYLRSALNRYGYDWRAIDAAVGAEFILYGKYFWKPHNPEYPKYPLEERSKDVKQIEFDLNNYTNPVNIEDVIFDYSVDLGYPFILAALWKILPGKKICYIQILQLILDSLCILLMYIIGKNFFSKSVGLFAMFGYAVLLPQIKIVPKAGYASWQCIMTIFILFILSILFINSKKINRDNLTLKTIIYYSLLGVIIGIATFIRSSLFILLLIVLIFMMFYSKSFLKFVTKSLILILFFMIILFPLIIKNYQESNVLRIRRGTFWHTILTGFGAHNNELGLSVVKDEETQKLVNKIYPGSGVHWTEKYEINAKKIVVSYIKKHPIEYSCWVIQRFQWFIIRKNNPNNLNILLLLFSLIGTYFFKKEWKILLFLWLSILLSYGSIAIIYLPGGIYTMHSYPYLLLLAGLGAYKLFILGVNHCQKFIHTSS